MAEMKHKYQKIYFRKIHMNDIGEDGKNGEIDERSVFASRRFPKNTRMVARKSPKSKKKVLDPSDYGIGKLEEMQFLRMGTM